MVVNALPPVPARLGPTLALVFFGYLVLALGAVWLARQPGTIATLWYANAFGITFLWNQPLRRWPALLGVMLVANMLAGQVMGDTWRCPPASCRPTCWRWRSPPSCCAAPAWP